MSEHKYKHYVCLGEQTVFGTTEKTTVGFIPVKNFVGVGAEFDDKEVEEFRGGEAVLGPTNVIRYGQKWSRSPEMPFFVESGSAKNLPAIVLKHLLGGSACVQNAATGQYNNTIYPVSDPRAAANLSTKAITLSSNLSHDANVRNHPHADGIVKKVTFKQAANDELVWSVDMAGSFVETNETEVGSPTYPAENLRLKWNMLKGWMGTITKVGSAPAYTSFTFGSATQFKPQELTINIECARELTNEFAGVNYPTRVEDGEYTVTVEFTIDFKNPSSGFQSLDHFTNFLAGVSSVNNFCFHWDTGVEAGTGGDNYGLYIQLPELYNQNPDIEWDRKKAPKIKCKFKGKYHATDLAQVILLIKNTATAI